jgi:hypothetical protein
VFNVSKTFNFVARSCGDFEIQVLRATALKLAVLDVFRCVLRSLQVTVNGKIR